jgi:bifunctional non-homologous end joining protein LigD
MSVLHEFRRRLDAAKAAFVEPSLPTLAEKPPSGPRWIHEIKHDGYRLQARKDDGGVHLITRNGFVWTKRYPSIAAALMALPCKSCVIDGEVVVVDEHGLAVFDRLRYGAREKPEALLYAFDLLELDGMDLRREPLETRKAALVQLLGHVDFFDQPVGRKIQHAMPGLIPSIHYVEHIDEEDPAMIFEHACRLGCEGIVSKLLGSRYTSGQTRDWIKVKNPEAPSTRRLEEEDWNDRSRSRHVPRTRPGRPDDPPGARGNVRRRHTAGDHQS